MINSMANHIAGVGVATGSPAGVLSVVVVVVDVLVVFGTSVGTGVIAGVSAGGVCFEQVKPVVKAKARSAAVNTSFICVPFKIK